jgi:hypothetical protein
VSSKHAGSDAAGRNDKSVRANAGLHVKDRLPQLCHPQIPLVEVSKQQEQVLRDLRRDTLRGTSLQHG